MWVYVRLQINVTIKTEQMDLIYTKTFQGLKQYTGYSLKMEPII